MAGAPKGNQNATKGLEWRQAIRKALAKYSGDQGDKIKARRGLELVATKFVEAAAAGEPWAMKELGDRMDGKPTQGVEVSGKDGGPIESVEWNLLPVAPVDETNTED